MRYAISYDISSDKRRRKVVKVLEGVGYRVQYSVFECDLTARQLAELKKRLEEYVAPRSSESIRFYHLCAACQDKVEVIGADQARWLGAAVIV